MPCKTRQAAERGERTKPHYYLRAAGLRRFLVAGPGHAVAYHDDKAEQALQAFEARIDWSTWGRSR